MINTRYVCVHFSSLLLLLMFLALFGLASPFALEEGDGRYFLGFVLSPIKFLFLNSKIIFTFL